ncbi:PLC-like phosphodiesterase [Xylariaceae sp. FL0016]|nr:PLC-like phosphodiesterase [Xylariaceae sp. FL0016]
MRGARGGLLHALAVASALATALADVAPLGQFALEQVLHDSRQIFGEDDDVYHPSPPSWSSASSSGGGGAASMANWMARQPDAIPLAHMNIPGTHDAATWNYTARTQEALRPATRCGGGGAGKEVEVGDARAYRCQRLSIAASLARGIRFFDLRFAADPTASGALVFWHAAALLSARARVADVLFGFYAWLEAHPSEAVVLSLQYETGMAANATFDAGLQRALLAALTSDAARAFVHQGRGRLGTLGEYRGKILLVKRFALADLPEAQAAALPGLSVPPAVWADNDPGFEIVYNESTNATAFIEDYYYPASAATVADNVAAKLNATAMHLRRAASGNFDGLWITFSSGTHVDAVPPVTPETMALGTRGEASDTGEGVEGVNHGLASVLRELKGLRLGIVVMDFFEEPPDLVDLVLRY